MCLTDGYSSLYLHIEGGMDCLLKCCSSLALSWHYLCESHCKGKLVCVCMFTRMTNTATTDVVLCKSNGLQQSGNFSRVPQERHVKSRPGLAPLK